ncbi:MAG: hypothetical protein KBA70_10455 [Aquabacterium sp.]|jgi:hypothetical protein|uniref:hypothetical protein n=1 Tax=Aquabacterium sp. TaxID=1872578 RepID=UPI001B4EF9C7|nr:hypothetical protein [Aquabacterium sp.]MBP7133165.1 hypothetical protein [Aquabacterium sp.]MDQ5926479.1 hypothetical protein [Pseudomonadota bacterium]
MFRRPWLVICAVLGACVMLLAAAALWTLTQALQPQPLAAPGTPIAISDLNAARRLINRDVLRKAFHGEPLTLSLTGAQARALAQDMSARVLHAPATLTLSARHADITLSLPVRQTPLRALHPLGNWLNVHARIRAAPSGPPVLTAVQVGELSVPPALALWVGQRIARAQGLHELTALALAAIETVQLSPTRVSATLRWRPELRAQASALLVPPDMLEALSRYHHQLAHLLNHPPAPESRHDQPRWDRPLHQLLPALMATAQQRSLAHAFTASAPRLEDDAARENRAVLLVLGLYVNRVSLATLVPAARNWPALPARPLTLQGREDLAQHYLTSAALATDLGGRLSDLIGMYKELLDAAPQGQGSGFSFNDLAADKAGVRLGRIAVHDPLELQSRLSQAQSDTDLLPDVRDLPEFLTAAQLQQRYGGIDTPAYRALMDNIDHRIAQTPALR